MADPDRTSVSLLVVVTFVAVLVRIASCSGWLETSPQRSAATQAALRTVVVTGDSVNLRQGPTRSARVLARAERGQELELLDTQGDWYSVRWGEGEVWLSKLYASPAEDCPTGQAATEGALPYRLQGEWKGEVGGSPATFIFYIRGERLCAYVLHHDVKEVLAVQETGSGALTLVGQRYERLDGSTGEFWLDTFSGQLDDASVRLAGNYADARNNRGEWFAQRSGSASEALLTSAYEDDPHAPGENTNQKEQPAVSDRALVDGVESTVSSDEERPEGNSATPSPLAYGPPLEALGACPLPKCVYGPWLAEESTDIHRDRRQTSPVIFRVEPGEQVEALQGVIVTTRPGQARAQSRITVGGSVVEPGEEVTVLRYAGDGMWVVWLGDGVHRVWIGMRSRVSEGFQMVREPKTEWWVEIRNESGQSGWTHQADHFNNRRRS